MLRLISTVGVLILFQGCASSLQYYSLVDETPARFSEPGLVSQVPFFPQDEYQCGPSALATVLGASKMDVTPEALVPLVYVPERQGSFQLEMVATARSFGRLAYQIPPTLESLFMEIQNGHPVLVLQNLGLNRFPHWHFAVVKGFDIDRRRVTLNSGRIEDHEMSLVAFERTWIRADYWAIVVLEPGSIPASADPTRYFHSVVALERNNPPELVLPAYRVGLERWPGQRELLMGQGNLLYSADRLEEARGIFETIIAEHPEYGPAHNNLAHIHLDQGRQELAEEFAAQAVALGGIYLEQFLDTQQAIQSNR